MDHSLTPQQVLDRARAGMTGDLAHDYKFLDQFAAQWVDHPDGRTIIREIGRMIADIMSPDQLAQVTDKIRDAGDFDSQLDHAGTLMSEGDYAGARQILKSMLETHSPRTYTEDSLNEYRCFDNEIEHALYEATRSSDLTLRTMPNNYGRAHFLIGFCSVALGEVEEAEAALKQACTLNPVSPAYRYELGEAFKLARRWEDYREATIQAMRFAYSNELLARGYRNLGFFAIEQRDFAHASELLVFSLEFDEGPSEWVENELAYIAQKGGDFGAESIDEIVENLAAAGIQVGPTDLARDVVDHR